MGLTHPALTGPHPDPQPAPSESALEAGQQSGLAFQKLLM